MKKTLMGLSLLLASLSLLEAKPLFSIGEKDGTGKEFHLSEGKFNEFLAHYSGIKGNYAVGYSSPNKHWPYVLPGPLDGWAGGGFWSGFHPRHFPSIWFDIQKGKDLPKEAECTFTLNFAGVHPQGMTLRVEINGHRWEQVIEGSKENLDPILYSPTEKNSPKTVDVKFPAAWLKNGMNQIQMGPIKGAWAIFDSITLDAPDQLTLVPMTTPTLIKSVKVADFTTTKEGKTVQPLLIELQESDPTAQIDIFIDGKKSSPLTLEEGMSIREVPLPSDKKKNHLIEIKRGDHTLYKDSVTVPKAKAQRPSDYVDLLIGTGNSRWMFKPGACLPFSMVQLAPDNQDETWKSGYEYTIENIMGFNHISDWTMTGFLMQPATGKLQVNPGTEDNPDAGYRSRINKKTEIAQIGYYSVELTDTQVKAELTATRRAAMQRYTFPKADDAHIVIDMFAPAEYVHNLTGTKIKKISDTKIEGEATYYHDKTGYSLQQNYTLYFVIEFDKPMSSMGGWVNKEAPQNKDWPRNHVFSTEPIITENIQELDGSGDAGVFVRFKTKDGEQVRIRSGISLVDIEGARNNLQKEIIDPYKWDFEAIVENMRNVWDDYLGRIDIETDDHLQKIKFYTNLYRGLAAKAIWSDHDGRYRDEMEEIKKLPTEKDAIVSGEYWNTFWNVQQLFNLVAPEMSEQWARSSIALYENGGYFNTDPVGVEHSGVMVAMHMISQIQGAWQAGIQNFSLETAYNGLKKMITEPPVKHPGGATAGVEHLVPYMKYGYIPSGQGYVSNTLEYAYDDWALAQMAKTLGKEEDYQHFLKRSENWRNLFDKESGFIRPKDDKGAWIEPFDPYHTPGFVEGNAFNYTWFVPQNPEGLVEAMGSERFISRLNEAMEKSAKANFNAAGDNFAAFPINHGNETSMEVTSLFNFAGAPWLSQKWARAIQEQYYGINPYDAYPGDEDLGQMSSWLIMSSLGFFQLDGGCSQEPYYELTSPRYEKTTLKFNKAYGRGQEFVIEAKNASKRNCYIQSAKLNGTPLKSFKIPAKDIYKGGKLELIMGDTPNKELFKK